MPGPSGAAAPVPAMLSLDRLPPLRLVRPADFGHNRRAQEISRDGQRTSGSPLPGPCRRPETSSSRRAPPSPNGLEYDRHNGNRDNGQDNESEILSHHSDIAEEVSAQHEESDPEDGTHYVVSQKLRIAHRTNAGNERCEGADDWNEACQNNSF